MLIQNRKPMHHTHPLTPPTEEIPWITLLSILRSHGCLYFAILKKLSIFTGEQVFFLYQTKEDKQWLLYTTSLSPVRTVQFSSRQMDTQSIKSSKHPPDSTHLCFYPSWHQVGLCWFFNICKSLQTAVLARFSQQGQVELMRMTAQLLNQIWGFNISWKRDRMWASINPMVRVSHVL